MKIKIGDDPESWQRRLAKAEKSGNSIQIKASTTGLNNCIARAAMKKEERK
jgi:hypothetical protein